MKIDIEFLGGARAGQRVQLEAKDVVRFGRRPENDVVFDVQRDLDVSGHHAELRREADGYYLVDVGSANGTYASGQRVTRLRIASGQELSFGPQGPRVVIRFSSEPGQPASVAAAAARPPARAEPARPVPAAAPPVAATAPAAAARPPSAGEAAAAALGPEHKVGAKTVALMIDSALRQADERKGGLGKSTVFLKSMVSQAVTQSTRKFRVITVLLVALLLGAIAGGLALRHFAKQEAKEEQARLREEQAHMREEMAKLMERQKSASSAEKERLAAQLEQLNRKLAAVGTAASGKDIVARNKRAVFLMAVALRGESKGYCTAFAVRRRVLATNAHCVVASADLLKQGGSLYVVMNQDPSRRYGILKALHHPHYHQPQRTISHDVGLLLLDGDLPELVQLASDEELHPLTAGDLMYTYGFPGRLADPSSPDATLVQGVIGRVTKLDGQLGSFEENKLIQHSAFTSGGTSGSPIFNQQGKVIAVNTGGYVEPGSMQVMDPRSGRAGNLVVSRQLAGYNFGIRIDVAIKLLEQLKE